MGDYINRKGNAFTGVLTDPLIAPIQYPIEFTNHKTLFRVDDDTYRSYSLAPQIGGAQRNLIDWQTAVGAVQDHIPLFYTTDNVAETRYYRMPVGQLFTVRIPYEQQLNDGTSPASFVELECRTDLEVRSTYFDRFNRAYFPDADIGGFELPIYLAPVLNGHDTQDLAASILNTYDALDDLINVTLRAFDAGSAQAMTDNQLAAIFGALSPAYSHANRLMDYKDTVFKAIIFEQFKTCYTEEQVNTFNAAILIWTAPAGLPGGMGNTNAPFVQADVQKEAARGAIIYFWDIVRGNFTAVHNILTHDDGIGNRVSIDVFEKDLIYMKELFLPFWT